MLQNEPLLQKSASIQPRTNPLKLRTSFNFHNFSGLQGFNFHRPVATVRKSQFLCTLHTWELAGPTSGFVHWISRRSSRVSFHVLGYHMVCQDVDVRKQFYLWAFENETFLPYFQKRLYAYFVCSYLSTRAIRFRCPSYWTSRVLFIPDFDWTFEKLVKPVNIFWLSFLK